MPESTESTSKFLSRKWMLTLLIQIPATYFLGVGILSGAEFAQLSGANIIAYSLANAAQYFRSTV